MTRNTRLLRRWYLPLASGVKPATILLTIAIGVVGLRAQASGPSLTDMDCSPHWTRLLAPADPDKAGTYQVCQSTRAIRDLATPDWVSETQSAAAAFAGAAPNARRALALLYGGRPVQVIRGWRVIGGSVESITLIAPPPDASLTRVVDGTLVVVGRIRRP